MAVRQAVADDARWIVHVDRFLWGDHFLTEDKITFALTHRPTERGVFVAGEGAYCYYHVYGGRLYIVAMGCVSQGVSEALVEAVRASCTAAECNQVFTHLVPARIPDGVRSALDRLRIRQTVPGNNSDLPGVELTFDLGKEGYYLYESTA